MPTRALIRSFVEASPGLAWSNRPDGTIDSINRRFVEYSGHSPGQLLQNIWGLLVHPDDIAPVRALRSEAIAAQKAYCTELRFRGADGIYRWHSTHVAPLHDMHGLLVAWYGTAIDIDDRRIQAEALRQAEARFRAVFESAAIGVARVAFEGASWLEVNDAFCRILGYSREELIGSPWPAITHPDDIRLDLTLFERMARGEIDTYNVEKRFIHKQGHIVWARLTLSLVRDAFGRPDFEVCLLENITERKQAEEDLRRSNDDLLRFSYVVSHDLHAPLRQIMTFSQILARSACANDPQAKELSNLVLAGGTRMQTIIRELLTMAGPGNEIKLEKFDALDALQQVRATLENDIREAQACVVVESPLPTLYGSKLVLTQVLQNLLSNALKYRHPDRRPEIKLDCTRHERQYVFSVQDNGQGIPAEDQERLFHWFSRVPGTKADGMGIGLASVSRMLERIGGRIWVESEPGVGSKFYFAFPLANLLSSEL